MTEKTTINDTEFDLGIAEGCEQAKEHVTAHIAELEQKKGELAAKLEASFLDFRKSKAMRAELQETKEELLHFGRLLQSLDEKHADISKAEEIAAAQEEIAWVEKQAAALAAVCEKEIPAASRKLAVIAAALVKNRDNIQKAADRAEDAGLEPPRILDPLKRILGPRFYTPGWYKNLRLPLLDKSMDVLSYWPLSDRPATYQDNPKINDDVEELLSAEDMQKTAKALLAKIDKRKVTIREVEEVESHIINDHSKPMWFELPRTQWAELLKPHSVTQRVKELGPPVQFWLGLPQQRKFGTFVNFLNAEQRQEAIEAIPEEERQQYLDHLMEHASNDTFDDEPESLESAA